MPDLVGLRLQRLDEMRMRVAERDHGDACAEVEKTAPVLGEEIDSLSPLERDVDPSVRRHHRLSHCSSPAVWSPKKFRPVAGPKKEREYV